MNIYFVKWGIKYTNKDVNNLYKSLHQYRPNYNYFCLTENPDDLLMNTIELPKKYKRVWGKIYLFEVAKTGKNVFFDIDNEIKSDPFDIIDSLCFNKLTLMDTSPWKKNLFYRKHSYDVQICSQIMGWEGDNSFIHEHFLTKWQYFVTKYSKGMDRFLVYEKFNYDLFPHELIASKKYQPEKNAPIITYEELEF